MDNETEQALATLTARVDGIANEQANQAAETAYVRDLIALATNPKAAKERIDQLETARQNARAALDELATARAAHDRAIAREREQIAAERAKLREAQVKLAGEQGLLRATQDYLKAAQENLDQKLGRFETVGTGGLQREFVEGYPRDTVHRLRGPVLPDDRGFDPAA